MKRLAVAVLLLSLFLAPLAALAICNNCEPSTTSSTYPTTARSRPTLANGRGDGGGPDDPVTKTPAGVTYIGSSSYSYAIPLLHLAGRNGLDVDLTLNYNSRVWTKDVVSSNKFTFNADRDWPAPGFRLGVGFVEQNARKHFLSADCYRDWEAFGYPVFDSKSETACQDKIPYEPGFNYVKNDELNESISLDSRYINRKDLTCLATQLKSDFGQYNSVDVSIFTNRIAASKVWSVCAVEPTEYSDVQQENYHARYKRAASSESISLIPFFSCNRKNIIELKMIPGQTPPPCPANASIPDDRCLTRMLPYDLYPFKARRLGIEGDVTYRIQLGTDGNVKSALLVGAKSALLKKAALDLVRSLRFEPGPKTQEVVTVRFRLDKSLDESEPSLKLNLPHEILVSRRPWESHGAPGTK